MRLSQRALIWLVSSLACACGGAVDSGLSSDNSGLRAQEAVDSEVEASAETDTVPPGTETDTTPPSTGGAEMPVLECPHGGKIGKVVVSFDCDEVTTVSCKALSNVVIEFADGARQRFEGLSETGRHVRGHRRSRRRAHHARVDQGGQQFQRRRPRLWRALRGAAAVL